MTLALLLRSGVPLPVSLTFELQKAIDDVLAPALAAYTPPVPLFDIAPEDQPYPFAEFARITETPDNELAEVMSRVQVTIAVWSNFRGQRQVHEINAIIKRTLDDATLTLDSGHCIRIDMDRADAVRDQDGITYTGTILFTALVHT